MHNLFSIDEGAILDRSKASYHTILLVAPRQVPRILGKLPKAKGLPNETSSNVIRTHPYKHPQHMKVIIHCICV